MFFRTPRVLFTIIKPSATVHLAGDLSRVDTHSSRFVPSKQHDGVRRWRGGFGSRRHNVRTGSHTSVS